MIKLRIKICFLFFLVVFKTYAQTDSLREQKPALDLSGFIDVFYAYDFNQPESGQRQSFFYNHNRHNEFNLNLGLLKLSVIHLKYRAHLALQAGTYANDNYASEPGVLKNIFEANAGISLNKKDNLWLDAGIFSSHIGFESAVSIDNWTLTRSILAENSPYYLSGAKLTYAPNNKLEIAALVCNGWQRIQRVKGNSLPSFGTQLQLIPNEKITLNWSTFIGTDDHDTTRRMRYFNNFYGQFQLTKKLGLIAGFDIGAQQENKNSTNYNAWYSPVLIARYSFNENWASAIRMEYYHDENGIIIQTGIPNGFQTAGLSLNVDYTPASNFACRLEGRWLNSQDKIFPRGNSYVDDDFFIVASIAVKIRDNP